MKPSGYTKIPGKGKSLRASFFTAERQHLYESSDHLMVSSTTYVEEKHKKFYFTDIQAITVKSNSEGSITSILLGILTTIIVCSGLFLEMESGGSGEILFVFIAIGLVPGIMLIVNLIRGTTCSVHLHTAVQVEELTCLRHFRVARKAIARINQRIHAAQGAWPESLSTSEAWDTQYFPASANAPFIKKNSKPIKVIKGNWNRVGFIATIFLGVSCLCDVFYMHAYKDSFDAFLFFISQMIILLALIQQINSTLPRLVQIYTWAIILFNGISTTLIMTIIASSGSSGSFTSWAEMPVWLQVFTMIDSGVNIILGTLGLLALSRYKVVRRSAGNVPIYDGDK